MPGSKRTCLAAAIVGVCSVTLAGTTLARTADAQIATRTLKAAKSARAAGL